ncbi:MAG TPA: dynamin family protein [Gemmatimonadales bacterium]|nr:dynamin family protein [Gemmatimonadales bacterium]
MTARAPLDALAAIGDEAGVPGTAAEARELAGRLGAGRFYVACVGEFKRGKSTLINSLTGTSVLPTGIVPVTAVPTILRHGDLGARVRLQDGWHAVDPGTLAEYVSEACNPGNRRHVLAVEVFVPSPLLARGLCLVDTPGLGSAVQANTRATREFLPHIDAVIAVLGADPPISGEELSFIAEAAAGVEMLLVVLNKADRIPAADRAEAAAFTARLLCERLGRAPSRIFEVSALAGQRDGVTHGEWLELLAALEQLHGRAAEAVLATAERRGLARLAARLTWALDERRRALVDPLETTEARARALEALGAETDRALSDLAPLLAAELQRLTRQLARERERFISDVTPRGRMLLAERTRASGAAFTRLDALAAAEAVARAVLEPWLEVMEHEASGQYTVATLRFRELANQLMARLLGSVPGRNGTFSLPETATDGFATPRRFYFTALMQYHYRAAPGRQLAERLMPAAVRRRRATAAANSYLNHLLEVNASRVEGDLAERIAESRRCLERATRAEMREVRRASLDALARARATQEAGERAVAHELGQIERWLEEIRALMDSGNQAPWPAGSGHAAAGSLG